MAISRQQVEEACVRIERSLEAYRSDRAKVEKLQEALETRQWLRRQYEINDAAIRPYLDRLGALGQIVRDCVRSARQALTEEYLRATRAANDWERRRRSCRDALVELAEADNIDRFDSPVGWIDVRHVKSMKLPKLGTPQREELMALIRESGRWEDATAPNSTKLVKAIEDRLFTPDQADRLGRICQVQTACRLAARFHAS